MLDTERATCEQVVRQLRVPPYDEATGRGLLRYLQVGAVDG